MASRIALLFDMDGVVCHNMPDHARAWIVFFRRRGIELKLPEFFRETMGMPTREVLAYYFKRKVSASEADRLTDTKEALYRRLYAPRRRALAGLRAFLKAARAAEHPIGLGTGSRKDNVDFIIDGLDLRSSFDAIVDAGDVKRGKPDPETFLKLADRLRTPPRRCVVFEDSLLGEEAARRAGMKVVAITTSHRADEFRHAALRVRNFSGLSLRMIPG
ncbi:MAG: beta-phosphoglucomutase family hydrolase [Elusimicrobia bacterium]|nr:beta-phosphoglucomutase family hydrolase [Elusimicrobiota bacterium]